MYCRHCGKPLELVDSVTYPPGDQFPWEHTEALRECTGCGKTELAMNGIGEWHPDDLDFGYAF